MKSYFTKSAFLLLSLVIVKNVAGQEHFRTGVFSNQIKTLEIGNSDNPMMTPIFMMNDDKPIIIQFDEMSHNPKNYYYSIQHCDADWTLSSISDMEAVDGFAYGPITDYDLSMNTTFLYTHYRFSFPNADTRQLKLSGNYRVRIYENNDPDKVVAIACFSLVEPKIAINATIKGNTDVEINGKYQQLEFTIDNSNFPIKDIFSEMKVVVRQNNRMDNQVFDIKPTYTSQTTQTFINNRKLIFEGGNQYRRFDFSDLYTFGIGIDNIKYVAPYYHVTLFPDDSRAKKPYSGEPDAHGKFVINLQKSDNSDADADYMFVHFTIPTDDPFFDGSLYILGEMNYNSLDNSVRMEYDGKVNEYHGVMLLKQGGYNYQYLFVPKGESAGTTQRFEGSFWQAKNAYDIYVYYRGWSDRYDRLIGVKMME